MLGRKDFTQDEIDSGKAAVAAQLAAYDDIAMVLTDDETRASFEHRYFNDLTLALDRRYVHRVRMVTGKDTTPLNELEIVVESLMNNHGVLRGTNAIKYVPESAVVGLKPGDRIALTRDDFARLSSACFAELETKFR